MARLEAAVYSILSNNTDVTGLVSTRIYPELLPQDCALPAVTYARISTMRHSAMEADPNFAETRMQISSWSSSFSVVQNLSDKVRLAFWRFTGSTASVTIEDVWPENETQLYDSVTETHQMAIDFMITHRESTS